MTELKVFSASGWEFPTLNTMSLMLLNVNDFEKEDQVPNNEIKFPVFASLKDS
jgi:hypothetical protein